jgi:imidazolonepropionase
MLRIIKRLSKNYPISIKATALCAHAFPLKYQNDHQGYIDPIKETT